MHPNFNESNNICKLNYFCNFDKRWCRSKYSSESLDRMMRWFEKIAEPSGVLLTLKYENRLITNISSCRRAQCLILPSSPVRFFLNRILNINVTQIYRLNEYIVKYTREGRTPWLSTIHYLSIYLVRENRILYSVIHCTCWLLAYRIFQICYLLF